MRASHDLCADLTLLTTNKMSGGQQLFGSNNLVIARREQENWASYHRQINRASERCETASCKLVVFIEPSNDLEIISARKIDGARVPFAKERDQPRAVRRGDIIRNLQQAMNCLGFDRWMFPELQQMRVADAPVPELYRPRRVAVVCAVLSQGHRGRDRAPAQRCAERCAG